MMKFFRNKRTISLLSGKSGKYLTYALGEIALVVIGILIALQINNWNEYRKDRIKEQAVLRQLKEEYQNNLKQLESKIAMRKILIKSSQNLLKAIENPKMVTSDSILHDLTRGSYRPTFDPIKNDLISSNKLSLIQNERLRQLLSQWETNVYQLNEQEWFWRDYVVNVRLPFLANNKLTRKLYYTSTQINKKLYLLEQTAKKQILFNDTSRKIDFLKILEEPQLEAILVTTVFSNVDANLISETLKKNILEISKLIDESLDE